MGQQHAEPAVNLNIAQTNVGPLVPITVSTLLSDARTFCVDVDLNHDGRFEGVGELGYAVGTFDEAGVGELRLHGLIDGRYRARVRVDGIQGETVSAIQRFELTPPRNSHLPISFEVNRGQTDSSVLFLGRAKNQMVYVTRDETVIRSQGSGVRNRESGIDRAAHHSSLTTHHSRFRLAGANSWAQPTGQKMLPGKANYFIGNDPTKWRTDIDTFAEITTDAYPGIRMIHRSSQGRLAYDFRVAAGANPTDITLDFPDAERLSLNADGDLIVHHPAGETSRHSAPVMYQEHRGSKQAVKGDWVLKAGKQAAFVVAAYDRGRELVIDPLIFSTYLGGSNDDQSFCIAIDGAGNVFTGGVTVSANFPILNAFDSTVNTFDAFVTKLNATGTALVYSTYIGGSNAEYAAGIAVDGAGNAYIAGRSGSNDYPTVAPVQAANAGGSTDCIVTKLNPAGNALVFSTYFGGTYPGTEQFESIALDGTNAIYVTGQTGSGFPTTPGAFQTTLGGARDCVVVKFSPAGALVYSTYLGGTLDDLPISIGVSSGNAYVTGATKSADYPTSPGAIQTTFGGAEDTFVTQLNATGSALVYSTYLGGTGTDRGRGIAVDAAGNAYVVSQTFSSFPTTAGAAQTTAAGITEAGISKINPAGTTLLYSTYFGGPQVDYPGAIAIDAAGNAYIAGLGQTGGLPMVNALQAYGGGADDGFVAVLNSTGSAFTFASYLGGSGSDDVKAISTDGAGNIFVAGRTTSVDFPTATPFQAGYGGGSFDSFIVKLIAGPPGPGVTISQSAGSTNITEGGATDTYTVVLNTAPTANVTITITPGLQVAVAPATLTFTTVNWNVAQTATVTAIDDALVEGAHTGTITHTSASGDVAYNAIVIASVTANITDNDGVPPIPPPTPGGGGIDEGSYAGSLGLANGAGGEGTFGFGRSLTPMLKGPYQVAPGVHRVFNVAHQQQANTPDRTGGLGVLGWGLMLLAVFVPAAVVVGRRRLG